MKRHLAILFLALGCAASAQAYTLKDLHDDCQAADELYAHKKASDPYESLKSGRCISYVAGFADGYAISDYLADKIGVRIGAFCLPNEGDLTPRLVRAVLARFEHLPPNPNGSTATFVASALSQSFPCKESLESKK